MAAYNFNRGINKSWEFQGLVGSNVYLFVGALGFTFLVFVVLYVMGTGMTICLIVTVLLGVGSASRLALVRDDRGAVVIDADLTALGPFVTILGGMEKGEALVGADYRERPNFWADFRSVT